MMVKIGDTYFAEGAIEAMAPYEGRFMDENGHMHYAPACSVYLSCGNVVDTKATEDEIAAAASLLGLLALPEEPETELESEELEELAALFSVGFRWAARDRDGKAFAYKDKPVKGLSCWQAYTYQRLQHDFACLTFDADAPLDLNKLFKGVPG